MDFLALSGATEPDADRGPHIIAIIACYNRKAHTLRILDELARLRTNRPVQLSVILVDDRCTDGTPEQAAAEFAGLNILTTQGNQYWAASMRLGMHEAIRHRPQFLLWLNDDVLLDLDAVSAALDLALSQPHAISVGGTRAVSSAELTYSGYRRVGRAALALQPVPPTDSLQSLDTMNGNFVVIPAAVFNAIGLIHKAHSHSVGDLDYGYAARAAGFDVLLLPGFIGWCDANQTAGTFLDRSLSRRTRLKLAFGPKGIPIRSHIAIERRFGHRLWPVSIALRYREVLVNALAPSTSAAQE